MNEHCGLYYLFCEVYGKTDQIEIIDLTPEKQENKLYQKRRTRFNENHDNSN